MVASMMPSENVKVILHSSGIAPEPLDNGTMTMLDVPAVEKLLCALAFAARKHNKQRRKDSQNSPFINHPIAVAQTLAHIGKVEDIATLQAAVLHDVLEDTDATPADLIEKFGHGVYNLVKEVTDDKTLPSAQRKERQLERAQSASPAARQILIADKICNVAAINPTDPPDWPAERKTKYILWADRVVDACRGCSPALEAHFDKVFAKRRSMLLEG